MYGYNEYQSIFHAALWFIDTFFYSNFFTTILHDLLAIPYDFDVRPLDKLKKNIKVLNKITQ